MNKFFVKLFKVLLGDMRVGVLLDRVVIDILGLLLRIFWGNKYILVVMDYFIKWVEILVVFD